MSLGTGWAGSKFGPGHKKKFETQPRSSKIALPSPKKQLAWPFTNSLNSNIMIWWGFFRQTVPAAMPVHVGANSLKKPHHIVILWFSEVVKGHAIYFVQKLLHFLLLKKWVLNIFLKRCTKVPASKNKFNNVTNLKIFNQLRELSHWSRATIWPVYLNYMHGDVGFLKYLSHILICVFYKGISFPLFWCLVFIVTWIHKHINNWINEQKRWSRDILVTYQFLFECSNPFICLGSFILKNIKVSSIHCDL